MRAADIQPSVYGARTPLRRRAVGFALAALANLLLILMLLGLAPFVEGPSGTPTGQSITIDLPAAPKPAQRRARSKAVAKRATAATPPPPPPVAPPPTPTGLTGLMVVSKDVFTGSDISKMPTHAETQVADAGRTGADNGAPGDDGGSTGPNGERLYNAQWYRKPSDAELNFYLRARTPPGSWATIACKTIPNFQVEDCVELDESPRGSGLARAIRQAAGGFLVRPPRIGGKSMVGEWVRIRIDFTGAGAH